MPNRILNALLVTVCFSFLMMSCGGGGGGGAAAPPPPPCNNCIGVSSSDLPFGDVTLESYMEQVIAITNNGSDDLIIGRISQRNPLTQPFSIWLDDCSGKTLPPAQMCPVKVRFTPTGVGSGLNDSFDIPSNDPNTITVTLRGNGIPKIIPTPPPPANLNVTNDVLFGDVVTGLTSTRTITISNIGSLNLDIGQIAGANQLAAPFSIVSDACSGTVLGANKNCAFGIRFAPTGQLGALMDSFDIASNDPAKPSVTVFVSGNGIAPPPTPPPTPPPPPPPPSIGVSSTNIAFGNVVWNNVSDQAITIQNTAAAGSDNLSIGQIASSNPLLAPFGIASDNCSGVKLEPTQTCAFNVRFSPTNQGSGLSDFFDIPSDDPIKSSLTVAVSGNGRALRVSINEVETNNCPDNIVMSITVADKDGNPIAALLEDDMALSENGVLQSVTDFSTALLPTPVSVVLTLDVSGTLTNQFPNVKLYSKEFVGQLHLGDEAAIISFSQLIQLKQGFTSDIAALQASIDGLALSGDRTLLYDALWAAIDNAATLAIPTNNRSIVLISDGKDQDNNAVSPGPGSVHTLDQVITHAQENAVNIYAIGIGNVVADVMNRLATETGGQYFFAPDSSQLGSIYQVIRTIIEGDYSVTYVPTARGTILLDVFVVDGLGRQGEVSRTVQGCP
ncbi:MAG: VWA domain-containing protein [Deltaproteobacteria bacterium]